MLKEAGWTSARLDSIAHLSHDHNVGQVQQRIQRQPAAASGQDPAPAAVSNELSLSDGASRV